MRTNHKTGRQSGGKMSGIWEKIKERLGFGKRAEGDKEDDRVMYIIAGLGNPTREYEKTRHNVGFEVIDVLADRLGTTVEEKKFKGCYGRGIIGGQKVLLLKPQTFMNLSGQSVTEAMNFFHIPPERVLLVFDDISLDGGRMRIRLKGSDGGHNGMKNIIYLDEILNLLCDQIQRIHLNNCNPNESRDLSSHFSRNRERLIQMKMGKQNEAQMQERYQLLSCK